MRSEQTDAFEVFSYADTAPVVVSCEHGSARLPPDYAWPEEDAWLVGTHWSYDIGAADLARELAEVLYANAVISRFSRLLVDPNRELSSATLFRAAAEGRLVHLNASVDAPERERRIARYYQPYHDRLDAEVASNPGAMVLSMHSFTPLYEGQSRTLEVGVLFDVDEDLGVHFARRLGEQGYEVRLNEPYSGRNGLMYCPQHHATRHGRKAVEFEVRQDLAGSPPWRERFLAHLARAAREVA